MSKRHFTTGQVAELLAVTAEKVTDLIKLGHLAAIDVSLHAGGKRRYRIAEQDLEDFLLRRRTQPPSPAPRRKKKEEERVTRYY